MERYLREVTIVAVPASSSGDVETSMEVTTNER